MTSKTILPLANDPEQIKAISQSVHKLWIFIDDLDNDLYNLRLSLGRYDKGEDAMIELVREIDFNLNRIINNLNDVKESLPDED